MNTTNTLHIKKQKATTLNITVEVIFVLNSKFYKTVKN